MKRALMVAVLLLITAFIFIKSEQLKKEKIKTAEQLGKNKELLESERIKNAAESFLKKENWSK